MWYGYYPGAYGFMGYGWPMFSPYFMPPGFGTGYPPSYSGGFWSPGMPPFGSPMPPDQEIEFLKSQAEMLRQQLGQIDARVNELENLKR